MDIHIIKIENGYVVDIGNYKYYQPGILEVNKFLDYKIKDFFRCYYKGEEDE